MQHIRSDRRRRWWPLAVCLAGLMLGSVPAHALSVFACEPEWAALVRTLAPDAQVHTATHELQDPHHIEARPSLIAALRRADLAVCTGASLESGWLPMLQQRAGNPRVQDDQPGMFHATDHVALIDQRPPGGPFDGDVHAEGNPHVHLDPHRVLDVAQALAERLQQIEPQRSADVAQRLRVFESGWKERIARWERRAAGLKGRTVAGQHTTFAYLWGWLGVRQVIDLEPKPGMAPSSGHLNRMLMQGRAQLPAAVVVATYQDSRPAAWLAGQLGPQVPLLKLPATVTSSGQAATLEGLFDQLVNQLADALSAGPR